MASTRFCSEIRMEFLLRSVFMEHKWFHGGMN
ncbi:hypothetical protein LINGRAHAP2_LOCUS7763 [Linum grandiflorum]